MFKGSPGFCQLAGAWFAAILIGAPLSLADDSNRQAVLDNIATNYSIEILTAVTFPVSSQAGAISGAPGEPADVEPYTPLFADEFTLFPSELVKRSGLKRIVLCKDLAFAGQRRNAVPDFEHDTLYLEIVRGMYDRSYMRKVIHHDYFHMIDYRDDARLYSDERWSRLNPPGFKYGTGGKDAQQLATTSLLTDRFPGFLNHYSTMGVEEDKAEIFANLVVDPGYVENRAAKEPILMAKVDYLRQTLRDFCPEMNEIFWARLRTRQQTPPPSPER